MRKAKPAPKYDRLELVDDEPIVGVSINFFLDEVDVRLLAKGLVSTRVQEQAEACIGWIDGDPTAYLDRTDWPKKTSRPA